MKARLVSLQTIMFVVSQPTLAGIIAATARMEVNAGFAVLFEEDERWDTLTPASPIT